MADFGFLLRGLAIGLAIAAPVGPIALLCMQRTLAHGRAAGLSSGLGAATADAVYGAVAAFSLTLVSRALLADRAWIQLVGGALLLLLGLRMLRSLPRAVQDSAQERPALGWNYASTALLTLSNPATILSFIAVFAALGLASAAKTPFAPALLVLGVFLGSATWWLVLTSVVARLRHRLPAQALAWAGRGAGLVIALFGALGIVASGRL